MIRPASEISLPDFSWVSKPFLNSAISKSLATLEGYGFSPAARKICSFFSLASFISWREDMPLLYRNYFISNRAGGSIEAELVAFFLADGGLAKRRAHRKLPRRKVRLFCSDNGVLFFFLASFFDHGDYRADRHRVCLVRRDDNCIFEYLFYFAYSIFHLGLHIARIVIFSIFRKVTQGL